MTLAEKPSKHWDCVDEGSANHPYSLEVRSGPKASMLRWVEPRGRRVSAAHSPTYLPTDQSIHKLSHFGDSSWDSEWVPVPLAEPEPEQASELMRRRERNPRTRPRSALLRPAAPRSLASVGDVDHQACELILQTFDVRRRLDIEVIKAVR